MCRATTGVVNHLLTNLKKPFSLPGGLRKFYRGRRYASLLDFCGQVGQSIVISRFARFLKFSPVNPLRCHFSPVAEDATSAAQEWDQNIVPAIDNGLRSRQRDPFLALSLLEAVAMLHSLRPSTTSSPSPLPLATASALLFARPVTFKHVSGALALERPVAGGKSEKVGPPPREGEAHTLFEDWKGYLLSVSGKPLSTLSSNSLLFWWRQN